MNYERYYFTGTEFLRIIGEYLLIDAAASFLFFDSLPVFLAGLAGIFPYSSYRRKIFHRKRRQILTEEFLSMITAVSGKVNGGMSAENAFADCLGDMERMYGKRSLIVTEIKLIIVRQTNSESLEKCLLDLGRRSGVAAIYEFAQIFAIARLNSGQMRTVINDTVRTMQEKSDTDAEIEVLVSGKKLEQKIMCVIPLMIIAYLRIETAAFLSVLYHNPLGILVMSVCLCVYVFAYFLGERIVDIRV